jgi:transcriptional regulator with XRE-family HTH domain
MAKLSMKETTDLQKKKFGERLRTLRTNAGLTQKQLSEKTGYKTSVIARYEAGGVLPRPQAIETLAAALGVPVSDLDGSTSKADKIKLQNDLIKQLAKFDIQASFEDGGKTIILSGPDIGKTEMSFSAFMEIMRQTDKETEKRLASLKEKYFYDTLKINLLM